MSSKSENSLRNICRTCMSSLTDAKQQHCSTLNKQCIYECPSGCEEGASIVELLQLVQPQIKVQIKDELPKLMCSECVKKLQVTYEFLEMYKDVDRKFRKMLKECQEGANEINTKYLVSSDDTLEFVEEHILPEDDELQELTKYEIEIEEINHNEHQIAEEEDDVETVNEWPEFEDELPIYEINEEDVEKHELFDNPYSDASDNELVLHDTSPNPTSPKKCTTDNAISNNTNLNANSSHSSKQKSTKNKTGISKEKACFPCPECDEVLKNVTLWRKHMREHRLGNKPKVNRTRKEFKCEYCGKGEEPYLCIECGKSFKVVSSLNTHMLRHKGEKNIQCPHCPKKFVCSSGLYGHMMVHTKEKTYVCDICGSAFHMAYQLKKHNLYHNNIKNFPCEYCDMRFVTGEKQRRHMRTHTGEKPYSCKYCERAFAQSNDCIKHMRQHMGDNVYQCELCPLRFPMARDLRAHFAGHKDDDEETRARNLVARAEEERNLQIKFGVKEV